MLLRILTSPVESLCRTLSVKPRALEECAQCNPESPRLLFVYDTSFLFGIHKQTQKMWFLSLSLYNLVINRSDMKDKLTEKSSLATGTKRKYVKRTESKERSQWVICVDRGRAWAVCPHLWPHHSVHSVYRSLSFLWIYSPASLALLCSCCHSCLECFSSFCLLKLYSSAISLCMSPLELILVQLGLLSLVCVSFFHTTLCLLKASCSFYLALCIKPLLGSSRYIFIAINGMELSVMKRSHSSKMVLEGGSV